MVLGAELKKSFSLNSECVPIEGSPAYREGMETMSGKLKLHLTRGKSQELEPIILKLYDAVPFPFAVVFPDEYLCRKHCGIMQLKNFTVELVGETDFVVVIKNLMEGGKLLQFTVDSSEERDSWLNAFQNISVSRTINSCKRKAKQSCNSRLPSLEEVSEDIEIQEERTILKSCDNVLSESVKRRRPLSPRRRVLEAPSLELISEEEGETEESDSGNINMHSTRRRSSLKDCMSEAASRGGRSL